MYPNASVRVPRIQFELYKPWIFALRLPENDLKEVEICRPRITFYAIKTGEFVC